MGANVTAIDISSELLAAANGLSAHIEPEITFLQADAEHLPFNDASFDRVISTFGIMFAASHRQAASRARTCVPSGRACGPGLLDAAEQHRGVFRHRRPARESSATGGLAPRVGRSPACGGTAFERSENHAYHEDLNHIWDRYARGFGPVRQAIDGLDPAGLEAFRRDIDAYHSHYLTEAGLLHIRREYLVTIGRRR